jgi:cyclase
MCAMTRTQLIVVLLPLGLGAAFAGAQSPALSHTFTQIAPGVYSAVGTATSFAGSNSAIIVNDTDVIVVDSHMTPEAGRALLRDLKTITDKPVRLLINTHFHYDHANGNQVFAPAVDIIGHEYTRQRLTRDILERGMFADLLANLPRQQDDLKARTAAENDSAARARLEQQLAGQQRFSQQIRETTPTPPNLTMTDRVTLFRGEREIRQLHSGHGHTAGDVVVYLPKERIVCTGDLLVNQVANLVDGFVDEWPAALDRLRALDFVDVIPGHGEPFKGKDRIDWFQAYLRDFWQQASKLHAAGIPADEAARRIDMTSHKSHYASINGPGVPAAGVSRVYAGIEHRAE